MPPKTSTKSPVPPPLFRKQPGKEKRTPGASPKTPATEIIETSDEDLYADPGLPSAPIKAKDMPTAEEMQEALDTALPLTSEDDVTTPLVTRDQATETDTELPLDTMSVSSDVEEVKSDMQILATRQKESFARIASLEGELQSLRYDINTLGTQFGDLRRLIERSLSVEAAIEQREIRDQDKKDPLSQAASIESVTGGIEAIRKSYFSGESAEAPHQQPARMRRHRGE